MSGPMDDIGILVADDHHVVREAIATMIGMEPRLKVVAQAGTHDEALRLNRHHRPHLVLLDFQLADGPSIDLIPELLAASHRPKVLMLSSFAAGANVFAALDAGASGYLLKSSRMAEVVDAIRSVACGGTAFSGEITQRTASTRPLRAGANPLTLREMNILGLIAKGYSNDRIAEELVVTLGTIKTHVHHLLDKLEAKNRTEALAIARARGYLMDG